MPQRTLMKALVYRLRGVEYFGIIKAATSILLHQLHEYGIQSRDTSKFSKGSEHSTLTTITVVLARLKSESSALMAWNRTHHRIDMNGTASIRK